MKAHSESKMETINTDPVLNSTDNGHHRRGAESSQTGESLGKSLERSSERSFENRHRQASLLFFDEIYGEGGRAFEKVSHLCRERTAQLEKLGALDIDPVRYGRETLRSGADLADKHPLEAAALSAGGAAVCAVIAVEAAAPSAIGLATLGTVGFVGGAAWHTGKWAMNRWQAGSDAYWKQFNKNGF